MSTAILGTSDRPAPGLGSARPAAAPYALGGARVPVWLLALWALAGVSALVLMTADGMGHAAVSVIWGGTLYLVGYALIRWFTTEDRQTMLRLYSGGFLVRFICAAAMRSALIWSGSPELKGVSDYLMYESYGWTQAEVWRSGDFSWVLSFSDAGYFYLVAAVYTLTGRYVMAPTLVSALFGALAAVVTFKLAKRLFEREIALFAAGLAAFIPTLLFWSSLLYKDTIVSLLYVGAVYLVIRLRERFSLARAAMLGLALGPLFALRTEMAAVLVVLVGLFLLAGWSGLTPRRLMALSVAGLLLLLLLTVTNRLGIGAGGFASGLQVALNMLQEPAAEYSAEIASRGGEGLSRALYGKNLLYSPHLMVVALGLLLVSPLPGSMPIGMNSTTLLMPGHLVWLFLLPALGIGVLRILRRPRAEGLFLLAAAAAAVVGILLGGYFSNPRYLVQVMPLLLIVIAVGVHRLGQGWYLYLGGVCGVVATLLSYGLIR